MVMPQDVRTPASGGHAPPAEGRQFPLTLGFGAVAAGIALAFAIAIYFFGAETTIDATIATLAFGSVLSLGAIVCFKAFGKAF